MERLETPTKVLDAIYDQLKPLVNELARYNGQNDAVLMAFDTCDVRFDFK